MSDGFEVASAYVSLLMADARFAEQVTEAIENACAEGAGAGGDVLVARLESAAADGGSGVAAVLSDAVSGVGDAMGSEIGDGFTASLEESIAEAAGSAAEGGARIGDGIAAGMRDGGEMFSEELEAAINQALAVAASDTDRYAQQITQQLGDAGHRAGDAFGAGFTAAETAALASAAAGASGAGGVLAGVVTGALGAALVDAAAEAGHAAGDALISGIEDAAAQRAEDVAAGIGEALAGVAPVAAEAGVASGEALARGIQEGMTPTEALFTRLAATMPEPFVNAYGRIREGAEVLDEDLLDLTAGMITRLAQLSVVIETSGVAAADELATRLRFPSGNVKTYENAAAEMEALGAATTKTGAAAEKAGASMSHFGGGMGMASMAGFMLISFAPQAVSWLERISGVGDHTAVSVQGVEQAMLGMSSTVQGTGDNLTQLTEGLAAMSNGFGHAAAGLGDINDALTQLQQTDPQLAAEEAAKVEASLEKSGMSATDAKNALAGYNAAVAASAIALAAQQHAVEDTTPGTKAFADAVQAQTVSLEQSALAAQENASATWQYLSTLTPGTTAYAAAVDASAASLEMQARNAGIAADAQQRYLAELVPGTLEYAQALDVAETGLRSNASSARINAEAMEALLPAQARLSSSAVNAVQAYDEVTQATSEYTDALTAMYGATGNTTAAEATFTTDLSNAAGTIHKGKNAVDQFTKSGAENIQTFQQLSVQAQAVAGDIYQQTGSVHDANTAMQQMAKQIDQLATKSGLTKTQVQELNEELWGVKNIGDITVPIQADTQPALKSLNALLHTIDTSIGTVHVNGGTGVGNLHGDVATHAAGGIAQRGELALFGEEGPELGVPTRDMQIFTAGETRDIFSALAGGGRAPVEVHFHGTQYPTVEQMAVLKRELAMAVGP